MIQMINKLKKNQKGYTLVELIVVLVILAILAAFTIPAMLGFVDDARSKASVAEGREIYVAVQAASSEETSKDKDSTLVADDQDKIEKQTKNLVGDDIDNLTVNVKVADSGNADKPGGAKHATALVASNGTVKETKYVDQSGKYLITIKTTASGNSTDIEKYTAD